MIRVESVVRSDVNSVSMLYGIINVFGRTVAAINGQAVAVMVVALGAGEDYG